MDRHGALEYSTLLQCCHFAGSLKLGISDQQALGPMVKAFGGAFQLVSGQKLWYTPAVYGIWDIPIHLYDI